ncbi:hypothetical protein CAEBREN_04199 [Caenorhabditis brenneri]|uniref:RING-type domain-containing protein n=1 Tax=Caenorhabditis brenneri TaxID=135651 RepID=G0P807_CAEBE|nr:hypothetical protein CAEBREN_04199 [Caenorhabditis brenneri]
MEVVESKAVAGIRDVKLNMKSSCIICTEDFDSNAHVPKVLACGHSICFTCLDRMLNAIQVSYVGDGHCSTGFECPTCRQHMQIPDNKAKGFPNNYQLLESIAPQDARFMSCFACKMNGPEATFHICRECTIKEYNYDVHTIIDEEPPIHPDNYTCCSTCVLKDHNSPGHTVIDYVPIRLDYQCKKNKRSVDVLQTQLVEKFSNVRTILQTLPELVKRKEAEISKIVDCMERAKNRQMSDKIFEKYKMEMETVIKILEGLERDGGKMNKTAESKLKMLEKDTQAINDMFCFTEKVDLKEALKIPKEEKEESFHDIESEEIELPDTPVSIFKTTKAFYFFYWEKFTLFIIWIFAVVMSFVSHEYKKISKK